ncbi:MAG: hypothetical protein AAF418_00240 [Pseudomonadota bacterium]
MAFQICFARLPAQSITQAYPGFASLFNPSLARKNATPILNIPYLEYTL